MSTQSVTKVKPSPKDGEAEGHGLFAFVATPLMHGVITSAAVTGLIVAASRNTLVQSIATTVVAILFALGIVFLMIVRVRVHTTLEARPWIRKLFGSSAAR